MSPLIANAIKNIPTHKEEIRNNNHLIKHGFLNSNICLNAQTNIPHTENDTSYTIISVPNQTHFSNKKQQQKTSFEFHINEQKVIVIPMTIGTIFCYSGHLLTHCQQIKNLSNENNPFVNIVSYNSKRLLSHILKSIKRNTNQHEYCNK